MPIICLMVREKPQNGQGNVREKSGNSVRAHGWTPCCKYKYKFKYSGYLEDIKYFFNQVQVKYKYFGNKQ